MRSLVLAFVATLVPGIAAADECPADKVLKGAAESSLAGIDLHRDKIQDVKDRFGKPAKAKWILDEGSSWAKYKWVSGQTALGVSGAKDDIHIVQISGPEAGTLAGTGKGLTLGDPVARVESLYGTTYVDGHVTAPEIGDKTRTYCFADGTELSVGLDDSDRVMAIRLTQLNR
jgi:hypothetical protein